MKNLSHGGQIKLRFKNLKNINLPIDNRKLKCYNKAQ